MNANKLAGVLCPVVTPFKADLSPDPTRFAAHCRWLLDQGCAALAIFGTTSEANSLSVEERLSLFDDLLQAGIPAERLLPGSGCCALSDSLRLTRHFVAAGAAGVLTLPPFYYKGVSDEGLFRSYAQLVERVGDARLRLYLYHIPQMTQVPLSLPLIDRLLTAYPGAVAGIKDSSGDAAHLATLLATFAGRDFSVFPGSELLLLAGLRGGGAGCITATANVNPAAIVEVFRTWRQADADLRQVRLDALRQTIQAFPLIPAVKATIAHCSGDAHWLTLRPPLVELDAPQRADLATRLAALDFAMPGLAAG